MIKPAELFSGKNVMITGGLGMIGSTIARKLVPLGARVTLVDAFIEPYGANDFNIEGIRNKVQVSVTDIRDKDAIQHLVKGQDVIFNLAGQVSHNDSLANPFLDAEINYIGHLNVLECVRRNAPEAVVLLAGSRLQFGRIEKNPVDESHPLRPRTPYALNKTAAENMYLFYHQVHRLRCVVFRVANPYGPRSQMKHSKYSMVNWFIRQAMDNQAIKVFGDGLQVRDYIYVDDLAEAFIRAAVSEACMGKVFNVGSGVGTRFKDMVETIVRAVGSGQIEFVPWPADYINVETGDYVTDIARIREAVGWRPATAFEAGIEMTVAYYRQNKSHYWQDLLPANHASGMRK
ncbi:MAG: GDP-mannose 4,6-dehydratase [Verrucomicrobia bacterium]|nr:GDP-mannose 4,6-dehydratase [Verrucomicrobiota bacterium]MBU1857983.1 GDP-mannose 4,6-dehydratase [Verrucomicrobiota bacterium]